MSRNAIQTGNDLPIACSLTANQVMERAREGLDAATLFASCEEVVEVSEGYAFKFPSDVMLIPKLARWIAVERVCCRFFRFSLEFEADAGAVWLHACGPDGTKSFIEQSFLAAITASSDRAQPELHRNER